MGGLVIDLSAGRTILDHGLHWRSMSFISRKNTPDQCSVHPHRGVQAASRCRVSVSFIIQTCCLVSPVVFVFQLLLSFFRDISFSFSRYVFLAPLFRSLLVCSVRLDLTCLLSHSVADRLGPHCLFGGTCPILSFGCFRPLIDGSVGRCAPSLFLLFFHPSHLGSDVCLFIEWTSTMCFHFDQKGC